MFLQWTKKLGAIGIGHALAWLVNFIFDILLYVPAVWYFGAWAGIIMVPLSIVWDYGVIRGYSYTEGDWLGFEMIQRRRGLWARVSSAALFVYYSWQDPPRAFLLVRGRVPKDWSFTAADWKWLLAANLLGNAMYLLMLTPLVSYVKKFF